MMTALAMGAATATDPAAKFSKASESVRYLIITSPLRLPVPLLSLFHISLLSPLQATHRRLSTNRVSSAN